MAKSRSAGRSDVEHGGEMLREGGAVGQVGQGVVMGDVGDLLGCELALGDVFCEREKISRLAVLPENGKLLGRDDASTGLRRLDRLLGNDRQIARADRLAVAGEEGRCPLLGKDLVQSSSQRLVARNAQEILGRLVEKDIPPGGDFLHRDHRGHVFDDCVKKGLGAADLEGRRLSLHRMTEMQDGHHDADRRESKKEAKAHRDALEAQALQERTHRHIDGESAHHVAQAPGEAGLQGVVAPHAALLMCHGGVDGAKNRARVGGQEFRYGRRLGVGRKGLDGGRHCGVRGRRLDGLPDATDPTQAEIGIRSAPGVEHLDGVGAEARGYRRIRAQARANGGIIGDEGVDQPERGDLFLALMLLEPAQARGIEAKRRRQRDEGAKDEMHA